MPPRDSRHFVPALVTLGEIRAFFSADHARPRPDPVNLLHRLVEGKPVDTPPIKAPQALTLTNEPHAVAREEHLHAGFSEQS